MDQESYKMSEKEIFKNVIFPNNIVCCNELQEVNKKVTTNKNKTGAWDRNLKKKNKWTTKKTEQTESIF